MDRRERDQTGMMLIEGLKELNLAADSGVILNRLFYCEELLQGADEKIILKRAKEQGTELIPVNLRVFQKMVFREDSFGLVATARQPERTLSDIPLKNSPLVAVIEGVEKPGNLGAVLRSADAAGVNGVIVCGRSADIFNPNAIRASIGTVFTVPVIEAAARESVTWLKGKEIKIIAATPHAKSEYYDVDLKAPCAVVMGSEHEGLSNIWLEEADEMVRIPMKGKADSLNLAVSTAILLYEAVRQRRKKPTQAS